MDLKKDLETQRDVLKKSIRNYLRLAWACIALAVLLFVFYAFCPFFIYNLFPVNTHDYAIAIPVLLASIAGVFFVYIAFLGQRWQMLYQQQEIRDNRQEMKLSTEELKNQAKALTGQISRMDRDFINQNFFRILEQHFKTRDMLTYSNMENFNMNPDIAKPGLQKYSGEKTFIGVFRFLLDWIDNEEGWNKQLSGNQPEMFEIMHGFKWVDKNFNFKLSDLPQLKLVSQGGDYHGLNKNQIQFLFRYLLSELEFDTYIRSIINLLEYVKENSLSKYLRVIESGMGNQERVFLFYFLTTQFELRNEFDLMEWLMENDFLFSIGAKELLDPLHKSLLYPKDGELPIAYIIPQ
ncbi:hypothetical protein [Cyclobacterium marinum]|uniref:Phage abortive infection protein n=1 Tax=Cyclobacterium marinum (strain ATCC 25205 / DSM 745 / LMG 13164 / NCIMB 1802) TaxID=880070 RepID=G0J1Z0_CYCMS|nr:hypothetical protein [Cyclobacterium marinum]AEL23996.1 hypothetical protein Cycma_0214 [Cyclobacterium marinum DSM 745]